MAQTPTPSTAPAGGAQPRPDGEPLPRKSFKEAKLPSEPASDRKLTLEGGVKLRERLVLIRASSETTVTTAETSTPLAIAYAFTNALLTADDKVATDAEGRSMISSRHELVLTTEALGRLGTEEAVQEAVLVAREEAAARAAMEFRGVELKEKLLSPRARI